MPGPAQPHWGICQYLVRFPYTSQGPGSCSPLNLTQGAVPRVTNKWEQQFYLSCCQRSQGYGPCHSPPVSTTGSSHPSASNVQPEVCKSRDLCWSYLLSLDLSIFSMRGKKIISEISKCPIWPSVHLFEVWTPENLQVEAPKTKPNNSRSHCLNPGMV